jgi:peptide/nickel transport system substrate-binding protein
VGRGNKKVIGIVVVLALIGVIAFAVVAGRDAGIAPAAEQVLTVGLISDPTGERWEFFGRVGPYSSGGIFETLVYLAADMQAQPGLATSWEAIDDRTWRFHLRRNVRFHSGRPFNAQAAKESLDAFVANLRPAFLQIESVTVVDDYTIDIRNIMPFPAFPEQMSHPLISIANLTHKDAAGAILPDGTGPFKHESHVVGQELVIVKNEDYWGREPRLERIHFRIIPDHTTRVMALRAGEIDIAVRIPMPDVEALQGDPAITVYENRVTMVRHVAFTLFREPVNDVRVRRAIAHAVDSQAIVDGILLGIGGVRAPSLIIPQMPWSIAEEAEPYAFDPARSKALLGEAGWRDTDGDGILDRNGQPFRIRLVISAVAPMGIPVSEAVQRMLRDVGIDLELVVLEAAAYFPAVDRGDHEMVLIHNVIASATGEIILRRAHSRDASNRMAPVFWMGEEMDALIDRATSTFDQEERYELYREIQREFHAQVVTVPINYMVEYEASGAHVRGFVPHNSMWSQRYDGVYIGR